MQALSCRKIRPIGPLPTPRIGGSLCLIRRDGKESLWYFGGADPSGVSDDSLSLTLNSYGEWEWSVIEMNGAKPNARYEHAVAVVNDGSRVIMFGGTDGGDVLFDDLYIANTENFRWIKLRPKGEYPSARNLHRMASIGTKVYLWGGCLLGNEPTKDTQVRVFNSENLEWIVLSSTGPTPSPRGGHSLVAVEDALYLFGGMNQTKVFSDLFVFRPDACVWSKIPSTGPWPAARSGHSCCAYGKFIIIFGGFSFSAPFGDLWVYDTENSTWSDHTPTITGSLPSARLGHAAALIASKIVIVGGTDFQTFREDVFRLELAHDSEGESTLEGLRENPQLGEDEDLDAQDAIIDVIESRDGQMHISQPTPTRSETSDSKSETP